jgi:uncharacterized protein (TIGR03437 family)
VAPSPTVTSGSTVLNAIPIYVGPSQIHAIMPSNTRLGTASLGVALNNARSFAFAANVAL